MTTIKKAYQPIYEFLQANQNKKVSTILDELTEMMAAKQQQRTFLTNEDGEVVAIYCYYHKKWELLEEIEYGKKASTASGYNTMCKEGVRQWTRQQKAIKEAEAGLLEKLTKGELTVEELPQAREQIQEEAKEIKPHSIVGNFFDTAEEVLEFLNSN